MNGNEKNKDVKRDEDYIFEGGTGNDKKTTKEDLQKAHEKKSAFEGLRSMIINPDDDEEVEKKNDKTGSE